MTVFQVLQIDPEATDTELKKRFRAVRNLPPDTLADSSISLDKMYHTHFGNREGKQIAIPIHILISASFLYTALHFGTS